MFYGIFNNLHSRLLDPYLQPNIYLGLILDKHHASIKNKFQILSQRLHLLRPLICSKIHKTYTLKQIYKIAIFITL